jgi:hypothetical protein
MSPDRTPICGNHAGRLDQRERVLSLESQLLVRAGIVPFEPQPEDLQDRGLFSAYHDGFNVDLEGGSIGIHIAQLVTLQLTDADIRMEA